MTTYFVAYIDDVTGQIETIATPTADMPAEGLHEDIGKRLIYLTEANLPEEACKSAGYFVTNYWFNKTTLNFVKVGERPNDVAYWDFSTSGWAWDRNEILKRIRVARNGRLFGTDWTQVADNSLTDAQKAEALAYRQALRDMMPSVGNPATVEEAPWPEIPSFLL